MEIKKEKACAFTGHTPEKLRQGQISDAQVDFWLNQKILEAVKDGYSIFISGLARGTDIIAAEAVLRVRKTIPECKDIKLVIARPLENFGASWTEDWKERRDIVVNEADEVVDIWTLYSRNQRTFHARDRWMVDHANRIIAMYLGIPGGTQYTIGYAKRQGIEVIDYMEEVY